MRGRSPTQRESRAKSPLQNLDIFKDPIYVVNMKERKDRWKLFMEQDPAVKAMNVHRVNAFNGYRLNYKKDRRIALSSRMNIMRNTRRIHQEVATLGAVGCSISHATIWKKILASNAPYAVVMEDDATFTIKELQQINELAKEIPGSAEVWLLGMTRSGSIREPVPRSKWSKVYQFTASHAYVITRAAAKKLLEQVFPVEMHIDHYMSNMSVLYEIPMLHHDEFNIPYRGILKKSSSTTTVESNTSQHIKDGCSACHVPDHLSRFYRRVGPATRKGRIVHGILRDGIKKKVLTYSVLNRDQKKDLKEKEIGKVDETKD